MKVIQVYAIRPNGCMGIHQILHIIIEEIFKFVFYFFNEAAVVPRIRPLSACGLNNSF